MNRPNDRPQRTDSAPTPRLQLVGWASTQDLSCARTWRETFFYRTGAGALICHRVDRSDSGGEHDRHSVSVVPPGGRAAPASA